MKQKSACTFGRAVLAGVAGIVIGLCPGLEGAPPNDNFTNAIPILGFPATVTGSNVGATKEPGEPAPAGNSGGKSVWWSWQASNTAPVMLTTYGSSFDTLLSAYTGDSLSNLQAVASDNDSGSNGSSQVTFQATNGLVYSIAVDGYGYTPPGQSNYQVFSGSIVLTLTNAPTTSPPSVSLSGFGYNPIIVIPTNLTLDATAATSNTGASIVELQFWQGTNLLGSDAASPYSLTWSNVPSGIYSFTAVAVDSAGARNASLPLTLDVTWPPRLSLLRVDSQTGAQLGLSGIGQSFAVEASSNLLDWVPLATLTDVCSQATCTDSIATNAARRFYRASTRSFEPGWIAGWLHTSNTVILDGSNQPVHFHGINSSGMEWGKGQPMTTNGGYAVPPSGEYGKLARWGFNLVRLPVAWANIETNPPTTNADQTVTHYYNEDYLSAVDQIVVQFGQQGIAVILSMHQWGWSPAFMLPSSDGTIIHGCGFPPWLYDTNTITAWTARSNFFANVDNIQDWYIAAWTNLARRYVTNPTVVGADLCNEPSTIADYSNTTPPCYLPLDDLYYRLGLALLAINPHLLIVMQQGPGTPLQTLPPCTNQMVYSYHNYPANWPYDGLVWAANHFSQAQAWQVPLWQGEFQTIGHLTVTTGPTSWQTQTAQMLEWCNERGIHWSYWAYQRSSRPLNGAGGTGPTDWDTLRVLQAGF
jgi:hypothetical protein